MVCMYFSSDNYSRLLSNSSDYFRSKWQGAEPDIKHNRQADDSLQHPVFNRMVDRIIMNSCRWELYHYSLPLKQPLRILGQTLKVRKGLILRLYDQAGNFGEGEISPLPLMHPESLSQAETQLKKFLTKSFQQNPDLFKTLPPSVRFGFEMAWRTLFKKFDAEEKIHYTAEVILESERVDNHIAFKQIPVNALATGSGDDLRHQCEQIKRDGFKAVKIKVGQFKVREDLNRLELAKNIFGNQIALRVDANRGWEFKQATEFALGIRDFNVEYCEEPLRDIKLLEKLYEHTGMQVALDETLWSNPDPIELPNSAISALILKPGILGGWGNTCFWINHAEKHKMQVVISSSMESGIGLNWIAFTDLSMLKKRTPAGLDSAKFFQYDLADPPFSISQGNYVFQNSWPVANKDYLKKNSQGSW